MTGVTPSLIGGATGRYGSALFDSLMRRGTHWYGPPDPQHPCDDPVRAGRSPPRRRCVAIVGAGSEPPPPGRAEGSSVGKASGVSRRGPPHD